MFIVQFPTFSMQGDDFLQTAGTNIADTRPSSTLKLTPKIGYILQSADFSAIAPLPTGVSSVVFTQGSGPNPVDPFTVDCTITLDNPLTMPDNDLDLGICISGQGVPKQWSRVLNVSSDIDTNLTASSTGGTIDLSGQYNTVQTQTQTINANSGYYINRTPSVFIGTKVPNNFTTSTQEIFNSKGYLIKVIMTTNYLVDASDSIIDTIKYIAQDVKEIPANNTIQVNSYTFDSSSIGQSGSVREMIVRGVNGASFSVNVVDSLSTNIFSFTGTIPNTGIESLFINFPKISSGSETYTVTISGTLNPSLSPTTFDVNQYEDIQVGFSITSTNGFVGSTISPTVNKYFTANQSFSSSLTEPTGSYIYRILIENPTGTLNAQSDVINFPVTNSFTNIDGSIAGGSEIFINSCVFAEYEESGVVSNNKILMTLVYAPLSIGTLDVASTINIDNFLTFN